MQINKDSWHYNLVTMNGAERAPHSLCPYFWKGVWHAFLLLFAVCAVVFVGWACGIDLATWLFAQCGVILSSAVAFVPGMIIGWILLAAIFGTIFCIGYGIYRVVQSRKEKKEDEKWEAIRNGTYVEPQPNIIIAFIKARKEKFCPTLEFK
jgi:hypothetical protein